MSKQYQSRLDNSKGIIKDLESKLKGALARIKILEDNIKKMSIVNSYQPSNLSIFDDEWQRKFALQQAINAEQFGVEGGLDEADIKEIINDLISKNQIDIPIHDHTAPNKGGDCYAGLGAKLQ